MGSIEHKIIDGAMAVNEKPFDPTSTIRHNINTDVPDVVVERTTEPASHPNERNSLDRPHAHGTPQHSTKPRSSSPKRYLGVSLCLLLCNTRHALPNASGPTAHLTPHRLPRQVRYNTRHRPSDRSSQPRSPLLPHQEKKAGGKKRSDRRKRGEPGEGCKHTRTSLVLPSPVQHLPSQRR